jgi:ABC-type multidrug transport system fused ATPase/permease subunit
LALGGLPLFLGELRFSEVAFQFFVGRTPAMRARSYLEGLMVSAGAGAERIHASATDALRARHRALFDAFFSQDRARMGKRAFLGAALIALSTLVFIVGKLWVVWAAAAAAISLGQMTLFIALLKQGQNTATNLLASFSGGYEDLLYAGNLYALLDRDESQSAGVLMTGPKPGDGYRLENVAFTYPDSQTASLRSVSLHIPAGQHLGVVGANGSGKSTLIKLLIGLYSPSDGKILLDGAPLEDWDRSALLARTAALFQPFQRYAFTARDNIAMGEGLRPVDDAALAQAARRGLADTVIDKLPAGLDTQLSRQQLDGHELSGGEWQRLAVARAMVRSSASVLILDEPTSALDPDAEAALIEEVSATGATLILVSHRLSNLRAVERIVVLDQGRIVEDGTHDSLLAAGGRYAKLFAKQAGFYRGEG